MYASFFGDGRAVLSANDPFGVRRHFMSKGCS
jgi:hypothetical protein